MALHYPAYWLKVDLLQKVAHARFLRSAAQAEEEPDGRGDGDHAHRDEDHPPVR